ncbi:Serine racemase [Capsicum annuum]|nr:Serine racemase [Capsicum annuum]
MEPEYTNAGDGYAADIVSIREAQARIKPFARKTPVFTSDTLDSVVGRKLYFKCECFQKGGAFKFRGACNAVFSLDDDQATKGVVTHSRFVQSFQLGWKRCIFSVSFNVLPVERSGNHAAALSLAAKLRGIPAYVAVPRNAPKCKLANVKRYGGQVIFSEPTMQSRGDTANKVMRDTGAVLIPSSNDGRIIRGFGASGTRGGMASGVALAAKAIINPAIRIFSAEPLGANDAFLSKKNVEPSGAIGLAALLSDSFKNNAAYSDCKHVGIVLSGGNVDLGVLWNSFHK